MILSDNAECVEKYLDAYLELDDSTIWYWFLFGLSPVINY